MRTPERAAQPRQVAVTFDDLPAVGVNAGPALEQLTRRLLRSVAAHEVPAIGFVTEYRLAPGGEIEPPKVALLRRWLEAGLDLGNHTYSHPDINTTPLAKYQADIRRGETTTRALLAEKGRRPRYFRHPFLHAGPTLEIKGALEKFLAAQGYEVAPVTIDNQEWVFATVYDDARRRGAAATAERVRRGYLPYMETMFAFFEELSREVLGYEVRQVLLLHANQLNADTFDDLAAMMKRRGYRFISLEEALKDPAYRRPERYVGRDGPSWLHRWAVTRGRERRPEPREPDWLKQLYQAIPQRS
jgi:peptidoglycan/xylan/chitin deacetylase (PgdA/CDA1 family)